MLYTALRDYIGYPFPLIKLSKILVKVRAGLWATGYGPRHIIAHFAGAPMRDMWLGLYV